MAVIYGGKGSDIGWRALIGTDALDVIYGLTGNDLLDGRGGNDYLYGGPGYDTLLGGAGDDTLINGTGNGYLDGGAGTDWADFQGNDNGGLFGLGSGLARLSRHGADFTMKNFENIVTGAGGDVVAGTDSDNIIDVGGGHDTVYAYGGDDEVWGDNGNDVLDGGAGNDSIYGGVGDDLLAGRDGGDTFKDLSGNDTIDGGAGSDTLDYRWNAESLRVSATIGEVRHGDFTATDVFDSIERIVGSYHGDSMFAAATTTLDGSWGDDRLFSGSGANKLAGGYGEDTLDYSNSTAGVSVDLGTGAVSGGWAQGDTIAGFEKLSGSFHDDTLTGSSGSNHIRGDAANDTIDGGGGDDLLEGNYGDDTFIALGGNDTADGGVGFDILDYRDHNFGIVAYAGAGRVEDWFSGDEDTFTGIEKIIGSSRNDLMHAGATTEMAGHSGHDSISSGSGANKLTGGSGIDTLFYRDSTAGVSVNMDSGATSGGWAQGDEIAGFENLHGSDYADTLTGSTGHNTINGYSGDDFIYGRGGNDVLLGKEGNDQIKGGAGNDIVVGQHGADRLWGVSGADHFHYSQASDSLPGAGQRDVINDFSQNEGDKINLRYLSRDDLTYIGAATFSAANQVRFQQSGGNTIVEVNTTGINGAEMEIQLSGTIDLQTSDFML